MKKKDFVTLVMAVVGVILFGLGVCMVLLPEWDSLTQGIAAGVVGLIVLAALAPVRRRMTGRPAITCGWRTLVKALLAVAGVLTLGVGLCMVMIWKILVLGIVVGVVGIVLLLCLIPAVKGLK